ncbi:hypothetical protein [Pseudoalteromonas galatheae]|uniref:hypothetical protein n=1 Tax=Pseudoalteromonas galatheae TaxID=579562 RepID=UPI0030CD3904
MTNQDNIITVILLEIFSPDGSSSTCVHNVFTSKEKQVEYYQDIKKQADISPTHKAYSPCDNHDVIYVEEIRNGEFTPLHKYTSTDVIAE